MHIGFTGTQKGMTNKQFARLTRLFLELDNSEPISIHLGDCLGSDLECACLAHSLGFNPICHPPKNNSKQAFWEGYSFTFPAKDYLERNHDIVDESKLLFACPSTFKEEVLRSGTWATIRYAKKQL